MPDIKQNNFSIKIGGQAGQGVKSAGLMLAKLATHSGYNVYDYTEYPSLIRGGHNTMQIVISGEEVSSPTKNLNFLIALNAETIEKHLDELHPGSAILFDKDLNIDTSAFNPEIILYALPLSKIVSDTGGNELLINNVALSATVAILGGNLEILQKLIEESFSHKSEILESNLKAAQMGYDFAMQNFKDKSKQILTPLSNSSPKIILNGNEAIALGAITAGMQFASIYPMSPISNILHVLAANQEKYGYIYKQPEDEIAAINMAIGASFAGCRSFTATSGGGFCLMTEGLGLAAMTETPLVIAMGMRPGPATGLATWSEQGDLQFILHASHGDFPRIVLSPGDAKEAFFQTLEAFNLADKYQTPAIVLIDKNLGENDQSFSPFDISSYKIERGKIVSEKSDDFKQSLKFSPDESGSNYKRYSLSADGISPRAFPGSGNFFIVNSYEHDEVGYTIENIEDRNNQMKKRMSKMKTITDLDLPDPKVFGPEKADLTLVSWGSNKGAILEAIKDFANVNFLHLSWLSPFPTEYVRNFLAESSYIIDIECNYSGQLAQLIREKTGIEIGHKLLKYDGRPFFPEEIIKEINAFLKR